MDVLAERAAIDAAVSGKTICTIFADAVGKWGDKPALRWKNNGDLSTLTWKDYRDHVAAVTLALRSLGFGAGQFGLIMARNVPEHVIADLGIVHAGGAAISVYNTLAPEQIEYVANHSEATVAFVEDESFLQKFLAIRSSTPHLQHIVQVRGDAPEGVMTWESLLAKGRELYATDPKSFEHTWRAVGPEDTVSLIYTSGTTGPPKGVVYSHNNILWTLESVQRFWAIEPETLVSYLPLAHVAERFTSQWRGIHLGHEVWLCPDPNLLLPFLLEARPTMFVGVPRVWEKLMAGLRERTGPATVLPMDDHQAPSIGKPMPGVEVRLGEDGELLVRGGNVMVGYYKEPGKTADIIDKDGWVHSGDIGEPGRNGQFKIVDRKKELIITSSGKNISPANLESLAKSSPIIGQAVAVGDGRNFIPVLVVLDPQVAPMWAKARGIEASTMAALADDPAVVGEVRRALTEANTHLSRVEQFKRFTILSAEWSPESEELTPTMKLKRRVINSKYQPQIDAMYANPPGGHAVDPEREGG